MWFERMPGWRSAVGAIASVLLAFFLAGLLATSAWPRMHAGPNMLEAGHRLKSPAALDMVTGTQPSEAYSFRRIKSNYAGPAVKLRRTTGGTQDINFTAGGDFDTAAATAFCNATTCFLDTWYDQSGNARHVTQATAANQPQLIFNCVGSLPCARTQTAGGSGSMSTVGTINSATGNGTFSAVGRRQSGTDYCQPLQAYYGGTGTSVTLGINGGTDQWYLNGTGGTFSPIPSNVAAWHAVVGTAGAGSVIRVDETEASGIGAGNATTGGKLYIAAAYPVVACDMTEAVHWDGYQLTQAERTALTANQKGYWIPYTLDTFATPAEAFSFRRLKSSYAGPAVRLRRASDNATQDINFLSYTSFTGAPIDTAAANAFCAATTCQIVLWYDQSGNGRDAYQGDPPSQPTYVPNCIGTLPCARSVSGSEMIAPPTGGLSSAGNGTIDVVARRSSGTDFCLAVQAYGYGTGTPSRLFLNNDATYWVVDGGSGNAVAATTNGSWHAGIGTLGPGSVLRIDGVETAGTAVGAASTGYLRMMATFTTANCDHAEIIHWDGYMATAAERAALTTNQRSFWGIP